ncbi:hypothetical protein I6U33_25695 [Pseudomonas carnis]|uniref:hypothetical protein n=1 Tax=Pseudomonas carnis TaxID=2487355 RepID=UPI001C6F66E8|nr:hypothetical protein [Pseudomonas carnis]MBW9240727.1 hypothetical protein [Pseudomonas carnis]
MSNEGDAGTPITIGRNELNLWADIYCEARVSRITSVPFATFIEAPYRYLDEAGQGTALECLEHGHQPLMPAQVHAKQRIEEAWGKTAPTRNHLALVFSKKD